MANPFVTVLIDTYNHERFIEKAIVSVLEQDFPSEKMEILVVDDGSTDRTPEVVRKFEPRLRLIRKANGGQASAFNAGVSQARGEIVAFLDGDDWWAPQKLREVVDTFDKNPGVGVVGHGYYLVDMSTENYELVVPERTCRLTLNDKASARFLHGLASLLGTSKLTVRREVLDRILPVPEELVFMADAYIFYLAPAIAEAIVLGSPLCYYRVHAANLWETKDPDRERTRVEMLEAYVKRVLPRLPTLGVPAEVIAALAEPWELGSDRSLLARAGGKPWHTFKAERASYRYEFSSASYGYKVFKALALGLTLLMPPRQFYQLKSWYAKKGLGNLRQKLGDAVPAMPVRILRHPVENLAAVTRGDVSRGEMKSE